MILHYQQWAWPTFISLPILIAATNVVAANILVDATDGAIIPNGQCSISEAIVSANDNLAPNDDCVDGNVGNDSITLTVDVTLTELIDATNGSNGTPSITSAITLDGQGYKIQRDSALTACALNTTDESHEFRLLYNGASGNLTIQNLTLWNGCADGNPAQSSGGGIYNRGYLEISNSMIRGNQARSGGGLINSYDGMITSIIGTTISENSAGHSGGGIYNSDNAEIVTISNSTFSGNSSSYQGGGLYNYGGTVNTISNSTFAGNSATLEGGGIQNLYYGFIGDFSNNIITNSTHGDCKNGSFSTFNGSNNLIDSISNCPSGLRKDAITNFNTSLADNGCVFPGPHGCVETHALLTGSNAVDESMNGTTADQRGFAVMRTRDIGAYERQVELLSDCPSGLQVDGFITSVSTPSLLHQAILCANFNGSGSTDNIMLTSDIELTGFTTDSPTGIFNADGKNGTPSVESNIELNGQGHMLRRKTALDCLLNYTEETGEFRLLHVSGGARLWVKNLVLYNGCADGTSDAEKWGGGIISRGNLTITTSNLSGNSAINGGGVFNYYGTIHSIVNSTFSNNFADYNGGGLYNFPGTNSTILNSTFSNNSSKQSGGGIYNFGNIFSITNTTFSGNIANLYGGGVWNSNRIGVISNSTFSGNKAIHGGGIYNSEKLVDLYGNIITNSITYNNSDVVNASGGTIDGSNNLIDSTEYCPDLLSIGSVTNFNNNLADNGCTDSSPIGCVKTHALLAGSNAIDQAISGTATDQRGFLANGIRDIGAYEYIAGGCFPYTPNDKILMICW